jgi:hypothetical protein
VTSTLTYVYAVVRASRRPAVRDPKAGMPGGGPVRVIAIEPGTATAARSGGLWMIVSSVPEGEYGEKALAAGLQNLDWVSQRALAHERVVEQFLTAPAVLPMQLFTLFTSDDRALEDVARQRARITRILARVAGNIEWGLRLTFDEAAARAVVEKKHARAGAKAAKGAARAKGATGAAYLARKRDLLDVSRKQVEHARVAATRLYRAMSREATDARRRTATERAAPGSRLLLDAAFLVPARGGARFRSALRKHAHPLEGAGIIVSLTGPWPPYNFISG